MKYIPNVTPWLTNTIISSNVFDLNNLETGFEGALVSLNKESHLLFDDLLKEEVFNDIYFLIKQARYFITENDILKKNLRLKLLDHFELSLRRGFVFDKSTYRPSLSWTTDKEILAEVFVHLKNLRNQDGKPLLNNSFEDIALFLKQNFDIYNDTELSTIQGTLKKLPKKILDRTNKVKLEINK